MRAPNFAAPLIALMPSLAILPVLISLFSNLHTGGLSVIATFISAAFKPSFDQLVIESAWEGVKVTFSTAIIGWFISTLTGFILGIASSSIVWETFKGPKWAPVTIRRCLAIPRSIHELLWGLLLLQIMGLNSVVAILAIVIPYSCLIARVFSNQIDALNRNSLVALTQNGSNPLSALFTAIGPPIFPLIISYSSYRFECALRGATLLGVFGLGGIGIDLQLSFQSLQFNEMWTCLWMLGIMMFSLEIGISWCRTNIDSLYTFKKIIFAIFSLLILVSVTSNFWVKSQGVESIFSINWHELHLPSLQKIRSSFIQLPLLNLIGSTLLLTFLSAGIAIGIPPLGMMLFPNKLGKQLQSILWAVFRLIPPPISALLLLLITNPSLGVAALALGTHNIGIMGRLLKEGLDNQCDKKWKAINSTGADQSSSWLYGYMSEKSPSYLAYSAYRTDVLLRETAVVGLIGGSGLGWQLIESLSSFNWSEVIVLMAAYSTITLIGETISDYLSYKWHKSTTMKSQPLALQS